MAWTAGSADAGALGLWGYRAMGLWGYGAMGLWGYGAMGYGLWAMGYGRRGVGGGDESWPIWLWEFLALLAVLDACAATKTFRSTATCMR